MIGISHGLNSECASGDHEACSGLRPGNYHPNCPCSCHHGRTVSGVCATYGCDCHEQERHGLPFSRKHYIACRITIERDGDDTAGTADHNRRV